MDLTRYVEELEQQLLVTADLGGEEARALADRLVPHLEAMARLVLLDALSAAAAEITTELAPGSVAVRLRGREPEFDVVPPPPSVLSGDVTDLPAPPPPARGDPAGDPDEGEIARVTLRLPEPLKAQVERAAAAERLSVNAWLVRAVAVAVDERRPDHRATPTTAVNATSSVAGQRLTGWAR